MAQRCAAFFEIVGSMLWRRVGPSGHGWVLTLKQKLLWAVARASAGVHLAAQCTITTYVGSLHCSLDTWYCKTVGAMWPPLCPHESCVMATLIPVTGQCGYTIEVLEVHCTDLYSYWVKHMVCRLGEVSCIMYHDTSMYDRTMVGIPTCSIR